MVWQKIAVDVTATTLFLSDINVFEGREAERAVLSKESVYGTVIA